MGLEEGPPWRVWPVVATLMLAAILVYVCVIQILHPKSSLWDAAQYLPFILWRVTKKVSVARIHESTIWLTISLTSVTVVFWYKPELIKLDNLPQSFITCDITCEFTCFLRSLKFFYLGRPFNWGLGTASINCKSSPAPPSYPQTETCTGCLAWLLHICIQK